MTEKKTYNDAYKESYVPDCEVETSPLESLVTDKASKKYSKPEPYKTLKVRFKTEEEFNEFHEKFTQQIPSNANKIVYVPATESSSTKLNDFFKE